jgi:DNA-3-methyladenine glycosylase II
MPIPAQHLKAARLHIQKVDPTMKKIVKAVGPCTIKTKPDRFMTLVSSILSQQISAAAAQTIQGKLVNAVQPERICPEVLLTFDLEQFRSLGISRQKAGYILDLAGKVHTGEVNLKGVSRLDDEGVIVELTKIKGIGPWTAQMFLMFCLGRLDVFPANDLGIQNAIKKHYKPRGEFSPNRLEKIAQPWRPYATIASWYLWRSLEVEI